MNWHKIVILFVYFLKIFIKLYQQITGQYNYYQKFSVGKKGYERINPFSIFIHKMQYKHTNPSILQILYICCFNESSNQIEIINQIHVLNLINGYDFNQQFIQKSLLELKINKKEKENIYGTFCFFIHLLLSCQVWFLLNGPSTTTGLFKAR